MIIVPLAVLEQAQRIALGRLVGDFISAIYRKTSAPWSHMQNTNASATQWRTHFLPARSVKKMEYASFSSTLSTTTSRRLPAELKAETRAVKSRSAKLTSDRILGCGDREMIGLWCGCDCVSGSNTLDTQTQTWTARGELGELALRDT